MEITPGGMIAVDTDSLREVGAQVLVCATRMENAGWDIANAAMSDVATLLVRNEILAIAARVVETVLRLRALAVALFQAADAYELVELYALQNMHERGIQPDDRSASDIEREIEQLEERNPNAHRDANHLWMRWRQEHGSDFFGQFHPPNALEMFGLSVPSLLLLIPGGINRGRSGPGRFMQGFQPGGTAPDPPLRKQHPVALVGAPKSLHDSVSRIPQGRDSTIRIERYDFKDGTREFTAYLSGTRFDSDSALSFDSATKLYLGESSQALRGLELAMADAGIEAGDRVNLVGHSQGGMLAELIAAKGDLKVPTLVTVGAPTDVLLDNSTTVVTFRHDDDLVPLLAGGGWPSTTGSDDSVLVRDLYEPYLTLDELSVPAHHLTSYLETVAEFESSGNERVSGTQDFLHRLAEAEQMEAFEYAPLELRDEHGKAVENAE